MKKLISVLLLAAMLCSLAACKNSRIHTDTSKKTTEHITASVSDQPAVSEEGVHVAAGSTINVEETIDTDASEFFVESFNITNNVVALLGRSDWGNYKAETGKTYADLCISYKNIGQSETLAKDVLSGLLTYAGQYKYTGFSIAEQEQRSRLVESSIVDIAPGGSEYIHYLFELPKEAETSSAGINIELFVDGKNFYFIGREETGESDVGKRYGVEKSSGNVKANEIISTENSEFYIEYSDMTDKVIPISASGFYRYYEADKGNLYVDVCFSYKNMGTENAEAGNIVSAKLKYSGKYEYSGFPVIETRSRSSLGNTTGEMIAPLTTEYIHYLFEVPEEIADTTESIVVSFLVDGNLYDYTVR